MLSFVPQQAGAEGLAEAVAARARTSSRARARCTGCTTSACRREAALAVVHMLEEAGLAERSRIVMEKPFGTDLETAKALNAELHEVFAEEQIFRIDHFLGKEAAQNILAFRFANGLFEPIWNRNFIDHVQIDVPETLGLETRAEFYESTGAYKDMVVTHLFQVLAFMAMEPPTALAPGPIGEEKVKVFRSMKTIDPAADRARPVRRLPRPRRGRRRVRRRHLHRPPGRDRQLALGRGAVLPAHRQEAGRGGADHLDRLQGAAAAHVPARVRRRSAGSGPPDLRPGRPVADVAVVLRQASRARA